MSDAGTPMTSDKIATFAKLADGIFKLLAAVLLALATWVVSQHESIVSGASILTQREQAEMELRASMLEDWGKQVLGGDTENGNPKARLLAVQLMALNFHDHFEFKPLLESIHASAPSDDDRSALRALGRRIIARQISTLLAEGSKEPGSNAVAHSIFFVEQGPQEVEDVEDEKGCNQWVGKAEKKDKERNSRSNYAEFLGYSSLDVCSESPDGEVTLHINLVEFDPAAMKAEVNVKVVFENDDSKHEAFGISAFDFPLTDNWQVDKRNRFALSLYDARDWEDGEPLHLKLVWFPTGYITARERPLSYTEMLDILKVQRKSGE